VTNGADYHGLPTLRDDHARVLVWCKACRHQADAPLQQLVEGRGDKPRIHLRYRCSRCRSRLTDWGAPRAKAEGRQGGAKGEPEY
jgi:hypothetical protein